MVIGDTDMEIQDLIKSFENKCSEIITLRKEIIQKIQCVGPQITSCGLREYKVINNKLICEPTNYIEN